MVMGCGVMSIPKMATGRNDASFQRAHDRLVRLMRRDSERSPHAGFDTLTAMVRDSIERLKPHSVAASSFIERARSRVQCGELDQDLFGSETASARVAISFCDSLTTLAQKAIIAPTNYPLKRVNYAVGILLQYFEHTPFHETRYSSGDALTCAIKESKVSSAATLHLTLSNALGDVPAQLGVILPTVPTF